MKKIFIKKIKQKSLAKMRKNIKEIVKMRKEEENY